MLLQLNPSAGDNLGKCLFPPGKASGIKFAGFGFAGEMAPFGFSPRVVLVNSLNSEFGMDINDVTSLGVFFSVGSKVHQEFGVVSNGFGPDLGRNLSWSCWPLNKDCA